MITTYPPGPAVSIIAAQTLPADAATIDFSSIPAGFRNLRLVCSARTTDAAAIATIGMRLNADSGANYNYESWFGNNVSTGIALSTAQTSFSVGVVPGASTAVTRLGLTSVQIARYTNTTFHKALSCTFTDGVQRTGTTGGWWASAVAVTQVTIINTTGGNFLAGSDAVLYGEM